MLTPEALTCRLLARRWLKALLQSGWAEAFSICGLVQVQHMRVDVETASSLTAGQTVCDVWGQSPLPRNVHVATVSDMLQCMHRIDWQLLTLNALCIARCFVSTAVALSKPGLFGATLVLVARASLLSASMFALGVLRASPAA